MASDCNATSQQGNYVKELSRYVAVDVYGECGNVTCDPQCDDMLQSMYKFHLSFENSLCPDYVTEKFFQMMNHDIVPVVYGQADYSQHAPPYSYIDARKFEPNELATYLNLLDKNDTLYNEYFWWKDYYRVESSVKETYRRGFCDLCQKLNQRIEFKSYPELASSWGDECTSSVWYEGPRSSKLFSKVQLGSDVLFVQRYSKFRPNAREFIPPIVHFQQRAPNSWPSCLS